MLTVVAAMVVLLVTAASGGGAQAADGDLAEAKSLYANASYEEAIQRLNAIHDPEHANQVDQYLALCLLALGRSSDA